MKMRLGHSSNWAAARAVRVAMVPGGAPGNPRTAASRQSAPGRDRGHLVTARRVREKRQQGCGSATGGGGVREGGILRGNFAVKKSGEIFALVKFSGVGPRVLPSARPAFGGGVSQGHVPTKRLKW